jgi:hypothetical protein
MGKTVFSTSEGCFEWCLVFNTSWASLAFDTDRTSPETLRRVFLRRLSLTSTSKNSIMKNYAECKQNVNL